VNYFITTFGKRDTVHHLKWHSCPTWLPSSFPSPKRLSLASRSARRLSETSDGLLRVFVCSDYVQLIIQKLSLECVEQNGGEMACLALNIQYISMFVPNSCYGSLF